MKSLIAGIACCMVFPLAQAADGLVEIRSSHSAERTASRLAAEIEKRGFTLFARVNHALGAQKVGKTLPPTEVFIFGNPAGGTPLMECAQSMGIDLPLKILVWQNAAGAVLVGYNDPAWLAGRHGTRCDPAVANVTKAIDGMARAVAAP